MIRFVTSLGDFEAELYKNEAPITVKNFLHHVQFGFYKNTLIHRVVPNFIIQGGGYTKALEEKDFEATIENEASNGLQNAKYTLAMARSVPAHSASTQFFININENNHLNHRDQTKDGWGYCVFGKVIEGFSTINSIGLVETVTRLTLENTPVEPIILKEIIIL